MELRDKTFVIEEIQNNQLMKVISEIASNIAQEVYVVGGYVRDLFLDRKRNDIDFLVVGSGVDFAKRVAEKLEIKKLSVFNNFGTAHFHFENMDIEFVGARKESYDRNTRKPIVEDGTFEDDILRRDFTINTLAISLNNNRLYDLFNGYNDLKSGMIKTPQDPLKTFDDDPLRILRAFRFASQLEFKVADNLMIGARQLKERLSIVSQERITDEFLKILASPKPSIGLKLLFDLLLNWNLK